MALICPSQALACNDNGYLIQFPAPIKPMIHAIQTIVINILTDHPPNRLLCIGRGTSDALHDYLTSHPRCHTVHIDLNESDIHTDLDRLSDQGIFDFTIISDTLEYLQTTAGERLLARLRDIHSKKILLVIPMGSQWKHHVSHWRETDLLALGFIVKARFTIDNKPVHVYTFDIDSYKTTPDWLNNKYWANPEMWNKFWW